MTNERWLCFYQTLMHMNRSLVHVAPDSESGIRSGRWWNSSRCDVFVERCTPVLERCGLSARECLGVETLLLPRTAALRALNRYFGHSRAPMGVSGRVRF